jgi:hypothetical protein
MKSTASIGLDHPRDHGTTTTRDPVQQNGNVEACVGRLTGDCPWEYFQKHFSESDRPRREKRVDVRRATRHVLRQGDVEVSLRSSKA